MKRRIELSDRVRQKLDIFIAKLMGYSHQAGTLWVKPDGTLEKLVIDMGPWNGISTIGATKEALRIPSSIKIGHEKLVPMFVSAENELDLQICGGTGMSRLTMDKRPLRYPLVRGRLAKVTL